MRIDNLRQIGVDWRSSVAWVWNLTKPPQEAKSELPFGRKTAPSHFIADDRIARIRRRGHDLLLRHPTELERTSPMRHSLVSSSITVQLNR